MEIIILTPFKYIKKEKREVALNTIFKGLIILIILILLSFNLQAEEFMDMVTSAESSGLGESFAANSSGPNSCWLNPAGLSKSFVNQYSIGGARWNGTIDLFTGSIVVPTGIGNFGAGVGWLGMPSEEYENDLGEYTGENLDFNNLLINLGYARELARIPIGVNLKFVKSALAMDEKLLILSDIGMMYGFGKINIGLMLRNFGISSYDSGDWGEVRAGASWKVYSSGMIGVKVLGDFCYSAVGGTGINTGIELELFNIALIRAGFSSAALNKFQFGTGFKFNLSQWHLKLDYGINPALEGLDMSHIFQITLNSKTKELVQKTKSHKNKAEDYVELGDYGSAEKEIEEALRLSPEDEELKKMHSQIRRKKNEKKAKAHFDKASHFLKTKDYEKAKKELSKIIKLIPDDKVAHCELGKVHYEQGDYRSAMECFKKALEIDPDFKEAMEMEGLIMKKIEEQKPVWLKEDDYYKKKTLVFDDFEEETIMAKFICDKGKFEVVKEGEARYAKWEVKGRTNKKVLKTAIRLPDLSKFKGMLVSLKSKGIDMIEVILVEQHAGVENNWRVPLSGIEKKWKKIKMPFHYLQLPGKPGANIDLGKITQIKFVVSEQQQGWVGIDNLEFYQ